MSYRTILQHPNRNLRKKSTPVDFAEDDVSSIVKDLIDTLEVQSGAGLAAPQIGIHKRAIIIQPASFNTDNPDPHPDREKFMILINPVLELTEETTKWTEACLSVPFGKATVERSTGCNVTYQTSEGETKTILLDWPLSGALQHENDHLDGKLYIDRISSFSREMIVKKITKSNKIKARALEEKKQEEILDLHGPAALRKYKDQKKSGSKKKRPPRKKIKKSFGKRKKKK